MDNNRSYRRTMAYSDQHSSLQPEASQRFKCSQFLSPLMAWAFAAPWRLGGGGLASILPTTLSAVIRTPQGSWRP